MRGLDLIVACVADLLLGEPAVGHPVRGMGAGLLAARRWNARRRLRPETRRLGGAAAVLGGACASWWLGRGLAGTPKPGVVGAFRTGLALSLVISLRALLEAGAGVRRLLQRGDLAGARAALARDLVSRDTRSLDEGEVAGATIQSLAENLNDAFVAPLFWASLCGPQAAYVFRFVNTADAVLGYRTAELEDFGCVAARADDALGLLPARLSALTVLLAAPIVGASARTALQAVRSSARATPSPNGGWAMAAVAGALDIRLEKRGAYVLHPGGRAPAVEDVKAAERLVAVAGGVVLALLSGATGWRGRRR